MLIADTSIGVNQDHLADLTMPFMQANISTTHKYGGTGLGMNLTEHLTDIAGIGIDVRSTPNKGTCFNLIIPLIYKVAR